MRLRLSNLSIFTYSDGESSGDVTLKQDDLGICCEVRLTPEQCAAITELVIEQTQPEVTSRFGSLEPKIDQPLTLEAKTS